MEGFSLEQLETFAKKVRKGFAVGKLTNNAMGINHAENQAIRRRMDKDNYQGTIPFYICSLCANYIGKWLKELDNVGLLGMLAIAKEGDNDIFKNEKLGDLKEFDTVKLPSFENIRKEKGKFVKFLKSISHDIYFCSVIGSMQKLANNDVNIDTIELTHKLIGRWHDNINDTDAKFDKLIQFSKDNPNNSR